MNWHNAGFMERSKELMDKNMTNQKLIQDKIAKFPPEVWKVDICIFVV